jgi:hypothetical protein
MVRAPGVWVFLVATSAVAAPPAPLACLERYYAARAVDHDGAWAIALPDGTTVPWNDGRAKSSEERLERPDGKDLFAVPYRRGPIAPVTDPDEDPGRVRLEPLLRATYPPSQLTRVDFLGRALTVHARAAGAFARVAARLLRLRQQSPAIAPFLQHLGGTYAPRKIAGTDRTSAHAYGISIDLDPSRSHYWRWQRPRAHLQDGRTARLATPETAARRAPLRWQNRVPQAIVDAFEAEGFIWGGRWYHYDTMHFEYRPELLDPTCQEGSSAALAR